MAGKNYDINFRIKTDAKPTRKELEMTVAEFKDFNKTVRASQTPLDRFEKDLSDLNAAFKKGAVTSDQYAHRMKTLESRVEKTTKKTKSFKEQLKGVGTAMAGFVIANVTFSAIENGLARVRQRMEEIDKFAKAARGLGTTSEFLSGLEFAAQRTSGLASGAATKGIEKMTRRIEEAALGTGEAIKALEMLGLEAEALAKLSPEQQFKVLSRAMDGVTDAGQRTLIATKLFDDEQSKLHTTMALTNNEYQSQIELAKELGQVVTEEEAKKAEAYADNMQKLDAMNAKYEKAIAMNSLGGLNIFAAESQMARGNFATGFLEGDLQTKAELAFGFLSGGVFGTSDKAAVAMTGGGNRAKTQAEIDEQRARYKREDRDAKVFDAETKRMTDEKNAYQKVEKERTDNDIKASKEGWRMVSRTFAKSFAKATDIRVTPRKSGIGSWLGGMVGKGINGLPEVKPLEKILSDPMASIGAGSSEAFRLQNQQTSILKTEQDTGKKTATNTKTTADNTGEIFSLMKMAPGIGL